jgi:hypothetical protein
MESASNLMNDDVMVMRIIKSPSLTPDLPPTENNFVLSTEDKKEQPPCLSVWNRNFTSIEQAQNFTPPKENQIAVAWETRVSKIRAIKINTLPEHTLEVISSPLMDKGTEQPDTRPGANGHCGIIGLDRPSGCSSNDFKKLRIRLSQQFQKAV